jgi:hypothetical protein
VRRAAEDDCPKLHKQIPAFHEAELGQRLDEALESRVARTVPEHANAMNFSRSLRLRGEWRGEEATRDQG